VTGPDRVEDLLRRLAPRVLGALVRRHGGFDACEDAVAEALLAAAVQWRDGVPERPLGWLLTVAGRALADQWHSDQARRRRELAYTLSPVPEPPAGDDTLVLVFLCCHPALSAPSQLALTLRAVGGLSTAEIARAFLVPEATMAQRISRAKRAVAQAGARFELPAAADRDARLGVVLQVLYLIFNEGYAAGAGPDLHRGELTAEATRLARLLRRLLPGEPEVAGLLALMLLTDARRAARLDPAGAIVPLAEQRRELWDAGLIAQGTRLLERTLGTGPPGPYQLQAAIAALHDEAPTAEATDWPQILALYDVLSRAAPGPMVTLSRAVALAMVHGPAAGLAALDEPDLGRTHRLDAVRAHLLERAGDPVAARAAYLRAAARTASEPEQRYLTLRAARLG
jgi:predicted RNA polymerase sigma factor